MTETPQRPDGTPSEGPTDQPVHSQDSSSQWIEPALAPMRRPPGRPRKGAPTGSPPLHAALARRAPNGGRPATTKTLDNWRRGLVVPNPRKLRDTLLALGIRGRRAAPIVVNAAQQRMQAEAESFEAAMGPVLAEPDGGQVKLSIETTVTLQATVRSDIYVSTPPKGLSLQPAQDLMANSSEIGWVTDLANGLKVLAPSQAACDLLGIPYEQLHGSYLLEDPLVSRLLQILTNPCEWLLIIGLQANWARDYWRSQRMEEHIRRTDVFYLQRLRPFIADHYSDARAIIDESPRYDFESAQRQAVLDQALVAALEQAPWPPLEPSLFNSIRMHIGVHDLLAPGTIARFRKMALPLRGTVDTAYAVIWQDEHADPIAQELRRAILGRSGLAAHVSSST